MLWLLLGGIKGKAPLAELAELKKGPYFRMLGIVLIILAAILAGTLSLLLGDQIVTAQTQHALQRLNGATVELDRTELRLRESRATIRGLALVNPDELGQNWFAADVIELSLSSADLLRRKFAFDNVEVVGARTGEQRRYPGVRIKPMPPEPVIEDTEAGEFAIDDYLQQAAVWRERLSQVRGLLERWERGGDKPVAETDADWRARIAERARLSGYQNVSADHLLRNRPNVTLYRLHAGDVRVAQTPDERWDITANNLSTQPYLLPEAPRIDIRSASGNALFELSLGRSSAAREANSLRLALRDLPVDTLRSTLRAADRLPFEGGSIDFELAGSFAPDELDLPLQTTFRNTTISLPGVGSQQVSEFRLPLALAGALDQPRLRISDDAWAQAMRDAGQQRLLQEGQRLLQQQGGEAGQEIQERTRGLLDRLGR